MSLKYIVPALAAVGRVAAQCSAATTTIQSSGDATALAGCRTFTGSIAIETSTSGNIALDGIESITGSLIVNNVTQLLGLSSTTLAKIGDSFTLNGLTILSNLNFPSLISVDSIMWQALPALQGLSFTQAVQEASYVSIVNTDLASLDGINLQVVDTMILSNNGFLHDITMQLGNVSTQMTVEANANDLSVSFPDMIWANNITLRNASTVSMPSLASVNGSLGFYSGEYSSLSAPNLTTVGGTLSFVDNSNLGNLSFPQLRQVGGALNSASNPELKDIDFPSLQSVKGALDFYGNFSSVELPQLNLVQGAFNLQSSENLDSTCNHFHSIAGPNNVIRGRYSCAGGRTNPGSTGTVPAGTNDGSGSGSSTTSSAFAVPMGVPVAGTFLGVVAAIFGIF